MINKISLLAVLPWAFGLQRYCKNLIKRRDGDFIFHS